MKRVDVLSFDGCPNTGATVERVREIAKRLGIDIDLRLVPVETIDEAMRQQFLGAPTVRVDGVDIDPSAEGRSDFGLSCRVYGREGTAPRAMIAAALTGDPALANQFKTQGLATAGALVAALLSSACCWLPLLLMALGVSAGGFSLAFAPLRPWFIALAVILLGFALWWTERRARIQHVCGCPPTRRRRAFNRAMLGLSAVGVLAFTFFPQYVNNVFGQRASAQSTSARWVTLHVDGMTCSGCEAGIESALLRVSGVEHADASYEGSTVRVGLAPHAAVSTGELMHAVAGAGYTATATEAEGTATQPTVPVKVLKDDLRPLSRLFNNNATRTQFLAILSPT